MESKNSQWSVLPLAFSLVLAVVMQVAALAQVEIKSATYLKLEGASPVRTIGDHVLIMPDAQVRFVPVGIVKVETEAANIEVKASNQSREPVAAKELERGVYCIETTGRVWVDVTVIDFAKNIYRSQEILIDIGVGPTPVPPGPGPGPGPTPTPPGPAPLPNGPFDGIALKVKQASGQMQPDSKFTLAAIFESAAVKIESREFLQLSTASKYINENSPPCTPTSGCKPLYDLLANDARSRVLSINAAVSYYREIAKGLR